MERTSKLSKYEEWCERNGKDPINEQSLKEYNKETAEKESKEEKGIVEKQEKQKEIFKLMCEYLDVEVEYDEDSFEAFDSVIKLVVAATVQVRENCKVEEIINK